MSQQELMPDPQSPESYETQSQERQFWSGPETNVPIYSWPQRAKTTNLPKSDHPATFESSLPPYSYPAQDWTMSKQQSNSERATQYQQQAQPQDTRAGTSTDHPYSQYNAPQQVPWQSQPQENSVDISKWIGFVLLVLILLMSIPALCSIGTVFVSIVFVFSLLPVILTLAPIAFILLKVLGPDDHNNQLHYRQQRERYEHSWWW